MEAALSATQATSTSLSGLIEALGRYTSGLAGAHEASEQLKHELGRLRGMLRESLHEQHALRQRVADLEVELEEVRYEGVQEHKYVRDEQDRFIAALIDEYEGQLQELLESQGGPGGASDATFDKRLRKAQDQVEALVAERELTRELIHRVQTQRDEAQQEQRRLKGELDAAHGRLAALGRNFEDRHTRATEPPPDGPEAKRGRGSPRPRTLPQGGQLARGETIDSSKTRSVLPASQAAELSDLEQAWDADADATPAPPPSFSAPGSTERPPRRTSAPPAELVAALTSSEVEQKLSAADGALPSVSRTASQSPSSGSTPTRPTSVYPDPYRLDDKPPLKRKPDHSMRPLVGYSKSSEELEPERLTGVPVRTLGGDRNLR